MVKLAMNESEGTLLTFGFDSIGPRPGTEGRMMVATNEDT